MGPHSTNKESGLESQLISLDSTRLAESWSQDSSFSDSRPVVPNLCAYCLSGTAFSNFSDRQRHLESRSNTDHGALPPEFLIQGVWGGAWEFAFLTSSQCCCCCWLRDPRLRITAPEHLAFSAWSPSREPPVCCLPRRTTVLPYPVSLQGSKSGPKSMR